MGISSDIVDQEDLIHIVKTEKGIHAWWFDVIHDVALEASGVKREGFLTARKRRLISEELEGWLVLLQKSAIDLRERCCNVIYEESSYTMVFNPEIDSVTSDKIDNNNQQAWLNNKLQAWFSRHYKFDIASIRDNATKAYYLLVEEITKFIMLFFYFGDTYVTYKNNKALKQNAAYLMLLIAASLYDINKNLDSLAEEVCGFLHEHELEELQRWEHEKVNQIKGRYLVKESK